MLVELTKTKCGNQYPLNIVDFSTLNLNAPVVFFTGENGSGKSTLLRVVSTLTQSINVSKNISYNLDDSGFSLSWSRRLKRGYYFQSEDFYSYLTWANTQVDEHTELLRDAENRHGDTVSMGKLIEKAIHRGNAETMRKTVSTYKRASHGEGYIRFFSQKLRGDTLYLLDEPESPLSFQNQLALLSLIHEYANKGSQFIICTHSPILLAYPGAVIYHFETSINPVSYETHPIVNNYTSFISNPDRYLRHLFQEDDNH